MTNEVHWQPVPQAQPAATEDPYVAKLREIQERYQVGWKFGAIADPEIGSMNSWDGDYWRPIPPSPAPEPAAARQEVCMDCDGCGWYEGGETLKTTCKKCGGTGVVSREPAAAGPLVSEALVVAAESGLYVTQSTAKAFAGEIRRLQPYEQRVRELELALKQETVFASMSEKRCDELRAKLADREAELRDVLELIKARLFAVAGRG